MRCLYVQLLCGFLAVFLTALLPGCTEETGEGDTDNPAVTGDDDTADGGACETAMSFLFGDNGCFFLKTGEGDPVTVQDLCSLIYQDVAPCYISCYEDNNTCDAMAACLTANCGLDLTKV
jgi:hypothetical protein